MSKNQEVKLIDFDKLCGLEASLYYNNEYNTFQLGDIKFEVIEDENDGYRSSMKEVRVVDENSPRIPGNFLAVVNITKISEGSFDGYGLEDKNENHMWLRFGTDDYDDYYPIFVFDFFPKA